jgi:hypothetical protein
VSRCCSDFYQYSVIKDNTHSAASNTPLAEELLSPMGQQGAIDVGLRGYLANVLTGKAKMKVLFHSTTLNGCAIRLMDMLFSMVSAEHVSLTNDIDDFRRLLLKYRPVGPIIMIHVSSVADVTEIKSLGDLIDDLFLIITTENDEPEVLIRCRRFYPRLLGHVAEDLAIVTAVIEKRLASPV